MEKVPERSVLHVVVEEEVAKRRRQGVPVQAHDVPVSYAPDGLELGLELAQVVGMVVVDSLNGNRSGGFGGAPVNRAGSAVSDHVLVAEVVGESHDVIERVNSHVHVKNHQLC